MGITIKFCRIKAAWTHKKKKRDGHTLGQDVGLHRRADEERGAQGLRSFRALQCQEYQAGKAIETGGVRDPQALKQTDCQLALERAG
ncbi:hypothetical protein EYF80_000882 [Liparis tanakae]|uniref:Uncharacterized protein n=1 Tax=Liparis tanakae TaxID=230148 RepID=A0A4Z2JGY8_9TELE|nr:hypothetical protein EYF80_000882 [Liparis tanakae]